MTLPSRAPLNTDMGRQVGGTDESTTGGPLPALLGEQWELVCTSGLNLLVRAPAAVTPAVMKALSSYLHHPILVARPGQPLPLRSATEAGTLVLHDVPDLTAVDQQRLLDWMEDASRQSRRARVISTATRSIVPLIQWGLFRAELYYRLNALYVDVHGVVPSPRSTSRSGSSAHSRA